MIELFQNGLLVILYSQYWMTISAILHGLSVRSPDGHHATAASSDVRMIHGCQLHARLVVYLTLPNVGAVQHVVVIVQTH